ncbi:MAG: hypothetical protein IJ789_04345 [Bacteroidales bacterium]|nr:hypothetical protein [Bacteroidales bacterium]
MTKMTHIEPIDRYSSIFGEVLLCHRVLSSLCLVTVVLVLIAPTVGYACNEWSGFTNGDKSRVDIYGGNTAITTGGYVAMLAE